MNYFSLSKSGRMMLIESIDLIQKKKTIVVFFLLHNKQKFYNSDFPPIIGSDLHSKLNGGIRTSINEPSSFSILKVLKDRFYLNRKII